MNKRPVIVILTFFMVIAVGYFVLTYISFEQVEEFGEFPIPKNAEVTETKDNFRSYHWSRASENDGIPLRYRKELEHKGWKVKWSEGTLTVYSKDDYEVTLNCQNEYLSIGLAGKEE